LLGNGIRPDSEFTHYENGTPSDLIRITMEHYSLGHYSNGYKDGVVLVHLPEDVSKDFYTYNGFPMFEGMKLRAEYKPRRPKEQPRVVVRILEPKIKAKFVDIVLYRWDVLAENDERTPGLDAQWEIVSINGKQSNDLEPMRPLTMARNFLHLTGGTKADYTAREFADAIIYWSKQAGGE